MTKVHGFEVIQKVPSGSFLSQDKYSFCLHVRILALSRQTVPASPALRTGLPGQGMVFDAILTPAVGNSQLLQIAVVGNGRGYENYHKNGRVC